MPVQAWIQTPKENVQKVKLLLEEAGQLSKTQKVKSGQQNGYMIIPTNTCRNEEVNDEAAFSQIMSDLHLCDAFQYATVDIAFLPSPLPGSQIVEPKLGPIQEAILECLQALPGPVLFKSGMTRMDLLESSPRRWSVYEPMLLLPSGSFQDATWRAFLESMDETQLSRLWKAILHAIWKKEGGKELTHLAINSGIPSKQSPPIISEQENHSTVPRQDTSTSTSTAIANTNTTITPPPSAQENILRSPSGLILLHGSFGPATPTPHPTEADFLAAFWATSKQNGIIQTWAPRHTMFSRGNIREKARILSFHNAAPDDCAATAAAAATTTTMEARRRVVSPEDRAAATAVDLYAGIGYFAFSYAAAGFGRVVCWELNAWSVEGLRRGCERNGWACRVVRGRDLGRPVEEVLGGGDGGGGERLVVVFEEGNEAAEGRMEALRRWEEGSGASGAKVLGNVLHVNCGFLPSSEKSWRSAWRIACKSPSAWLHLHENVGVGDVEERRSEIERLFGHWAREEGGSRIVDVEHVERVKTFAPGVWHCVFDVHLQSALTDSH